MTDSSSPADDSYGAFCTANPVSLPATGTGDLDGLSFAAKDVMDIIGTTTGFGQPVWLATHEPAQSSAAVVTRMLDNGAYLKGRTLSDELSYSLSGENIHYGTPANPRDATRVAGGSSSGSVVAVAAGLTDLAIGTDCAGSVRLPASYCGVPGMRPTHGAVSAAGVIPFAPSFDTVGWFARDTALLQRAGQVLLDIDTPAPAPNTLLIAKDCFELVDEDIRHALQEPVNSVAKHLNESREVTVAADGLESFMECFRVIQGAEIWQSLGAWITQHEPQLGPGVDDRIAAAKAIKQEDANAARKVHQQIRQHLDQLIAPGNVLCLPTSPRVAPLKETATDTLEVTYRYQAICLLSIAGLGGLPEVTIPLGTVNGLPVGLSLVGSRGSDHSLLELAHRIMT